ncbi:MAG: hypothetical protein ACLSCE_13365 [Bacteroides cellulosilyticus]
MAENSMLKELSLCESWESASASMTAVVDNEFPTSLTSRLS